jgi:hypothetical protein
MISRTNLAPAILLLALGAVAGQAQPTAEDSATPPDPGAGESSPATDSGTANSGDSPFDYRASEKISEDLPVSFPVDI